MDWLPLAYKVLKPRTHCYVMTNARTLHELLDAGKEAGLVLQNLLVWRKNTQTPNRFYMGACEFIVMFSKRPERWLNDMGMSNVFTDEVVRDRLHPTQKPVSLFYKLITQSTRKGELVCDPFLGVGTAAIAAKQANCEFVGCELDENYYNIALQQLKVQEGLGGVPIYGYEE